MKIRFATHEKLPIHVMGRTDLSSWPMTLEEAWEIFQDVILEIHETTDIVTHAFVLMGNHYHWLCTYDVDEDPGLFDWFHELLNFQFFHRVQEQLGPVAVLEPFAKVIRIRNFPAYKATYKYVYTNPVRAGLTERAEDYLASSLPYVLGEPGLQFPCTDNMNLIVDAIRTVDWLNDREELLHSPEYQAHLHFIDSLVEEGSPPPLLS